MVRMTSSDAWSAHGAPATAMLTTARARVLDALRSAGEPITAGELGERLRLHPTTVRFHLDRLINEGLATAQPRRQGTRGRPATSYRAVPTADAAGTAEIWQPMVDALAGALDVQGTKGHERAIAAGTSWARHLLGPGPRPSGPDRARAELQTLLDDLGFSPAPAPWGLSLASCPFLTAARHHPNTVCAVHLGLSRGLVAQLGLPGGPAAVELRPFAEPGACHLVLGPKGPDSLGEHPQPPTLLGAPARPGERTKGDRTDVVHTELPHTNHDHRQTMTTEERTSG